MHFQSFYRDVYIAYNMPLFTLRYLKTEADKKLNSSSKQMQRLVEEYVANITLLTTQQYSIIHQLILNLVTR